MLGHEDDMKRLKTTLTLMVLVFAAVPATLAQSFKAGDHVEALPFGNDWYPCVVTRGAPNYVVKCTNIDGTTSDYGVPTNRVRSDSGQAAAIMAGRWAQRFPIGSRVEAAPYGEQNGYHPCTVLSVKGNKCRWHLAKIARRSLISRKPTILGDSPNVSGPHGSETPGA
jgi:hypothetical protein